VSIWQEGKTEKMETMQNEITASSFTAQVLIVGDAADAFASSDISSNPDFRICNNMLDAITLSSEESFHAIFVLMSSFAGKLQSSLRTLRRVSTSDIYLLAQMHEEPLAMDLTGKSRLSDAIAKDYFICPTDPQTLLQNAGLVESDLEKGSAAIVSSDYKNARIRELEKLATEDDLTGLKNRRYVREFLRQIIDRSKNQELRVTLLVFDIDDFKHYNDAYGHAVGDHVLKQAAIMMLRCCRDHDVVGRIGGDEFAVVFWDKPGVSTDDDIKRARLASGSERRNVESGHPQQAFVMAERFRKAVCSAELSFLGPEGQGELTISGGLASFPQDGQTVGELFEQSDRVMLEVKRTGKNRIALVGNTL
jgi:diguanylate cyclase (GGDEF)-like protein